MLVWRSVGKEVGPIWFVLRLFQLPQQGLQEEATEVAGLLLAAPFLGGLGIRTRARVGDANKCHRLAQEPDHP